MSKNELLTVFLESNDIPFKDHRNFIQLRFPDAKLVQVENLRNLIKGFRRQFQVVQDNERAGRIDMPHLEANAQAGIIYVNLLLAASRLNTIFIYTEPYLSDT